jgi:hypothetical protein
MIGQRYTIREHEHVVRITSSIMKHHDGVAFYVMMMEEKR